MSEKPFVSVVIPVYNVERYLMRCWRSVASQTFDNWEAILVDDGSTDGSGRLCDELAADDSRVRVIHKANEGLGLTRNCGVRNSMGEYVFFLDSDDYLENDALAVLVSSVRQYDCDVVIGNLIYQGKTLPLPIEEGLYQNEEIRTQILYRMIGSLPGENDQLTPSSCGKLYRRSLFTEKEIWFPSERELIWEDVAFNDRFLRECRSVVLSGHPVYYYCYNGMSLTHRYDPEKTEKVLRMYRYMTEQGRRNEEQEEYFARLNCSFAGHIRTCLKLEAWYDRDNGRGKALHNIWEICRDATVREIIGQTPREKQNLMQRVLAFCIRKKMAFAVYLLCGMQNRRKPVV